MSASDLGGASSPQGGMEFTWPSEVSIEDILAAAERRARYLAGEEIPGRRKRKSRGNGRRTGGPNGAALLPLTLARLLPLTLAGLVPLAECPCSTRHWTIRRARMP
jgi:hypothetical protein